MLGAVERGQCTFATAACIGIVNKARFPDWLDHAAQCVVDNPILEWCRRNLPPLPFVDDKGAVCARLIAAVEQPLPRGDWRDLKALRARSPIPLMADESLVTLDDARLLLTEEAVDAFNIRVSKCGGLSRSVEIARLAAEAGVAVQVGSQVGETAILSAAGRHLAAGLPDVASVEGSYGTLLLTEDLSLESVRFGHGGRAPLLEGPGLGVQVVEERLRRHSKRVVALSSDGMAA